MTPILIGRFETRIFALGVVGSIWTLIISFVLPGTDDAPIGEIYKITFRSIVIVALFGLVWECVYHFLMYFRWEKDWPALFQLLEGIPEGITTWFILSAWVPFDVPLSTFLTHFITTWLVVFLFLNTFMRVLFPRWRFRGGRLI